MRVVKGLLLFLMVSIGGLLNAQDVHYSMHDMAPIRLNAAYTGFFEGTLRVGGIYRSQWKGLGLSGVDTESKFSGYQTPHAYLDIPFVLFRKSKSAQIKNWLGIGLSFFNDQAGVGQLSSLSGEISLAYHIGFGAMGNTRLSFGLKGGIGQHSIDNSTLLFEDEIISGVATTENFASDAATFADFSGGLMLSHRSKGFGMEVGFAVNHFTRPKYQFLNGTDARLPMAFVGNATFNIDLGRRLLLRPLFFYHNMANAQNINLQTLLGIHFNDMKDITFLVGGGYRIGDAAIARVGFEVKGLRLGFAYDINLNSLSQPQVNLGLRRATGFEVALSYIAKLYKKPVIKEILFCPRF